MDNIAIIPARSGSKGLKDKNIKPLKGIPLLAYSIMEAKKSKMFKKIFVSTDSQLYANIAMQYGADASFLRSEELSTDYAGSWDVVREVIKILEDRGEYYDNIMLLQPTSPLRTSEDIVKCFDIMHNKKASSVVSVCEMDHSPLWSNILPEDYSMEHFRNEKYTDLPRQMLPTYYRINGAVYLLSRNELDLDKMFRKDTYAYVMPRDRSVDIDSEVDFIVAEALMEKR